MPVTVTFDKPVYRIGEPAEITFSGLTSGTVYRVKLKNSITNAETPLFDFIAPGASRTVKTYVQGYWKDYDKIVVDGDVNNLPSILTEIYSSPLKISTDQLRYKRGEAVSISISNLITGNTYELSVTVDSGEVTIEEFTATTPNVTKLWSVPADFPLGVHKIRLYQKFSPSKLLLAETGIEVFEPTAPRPLSQQIVDLSQQIINWVKQNWVIALILFFVILLLLSRRK
jgi:hypothetical protein